MDPLDFTDKTVVITGGTQGIGRGLVEAFHSAGAAVWFCGRKQDLGESLVQTLRAERVHFSVVDLAHPEAIQDWFGSIAVTTERIDVLINNAGMDPRIPIESLSVEQWDEIQNINLRAYFLCAREASPLLGEGASVINLSSITFDVGMKDLTAYVASKGGIIGFTRSLAREWGPRGIRVNTLSPGAVLTERQRAEIATDSVLDDVKAAQCLESFIDAASIADVARFLASPLARSVTGQNLRACHGWVHG